MVELKHVLNMRRESFSKLLMFCPLINSYTNMTFGTFNLFCLQTVWVHDTSLCVDINTNNSTMSILIVLSSSLGLRESSPGSFDECWLCARQLPTLRPSQPTWVVSPPVGCRHVIYTHRHNLLVLLIPKTDTHFTFPQRIEGWVDLCVPWRDGLPVFRWSFIPVLTGWAWPRLITLIKTCAFLSLRLGISRDWNLKVLVSILVLKVIHWSWSWD